MFNLQDISPEFRQFRRAVSGVSSSSEQQVGSGNILEQDEEKLKEAKNKKQTEKRKRRKMGRREGTIT